MTDPQFRPLADNEAAVRETEKAVQEMKKVDAEAALKTTDPDA